LLVTVVDDLRELTVFLSDGGVATDLLNTVLDDRLDTFVLLSDGEFVTAEDDLLVVPAFLTEEGAVLVELVIVVEDLRVEMDLFEYDLSEDLLY